MFARQITVFRANGERRRHRQIRQPEMGQCRLDQFAAGVRR